MDWVRFRRRRWPVLLVTAALAVALFGLLLLAFGAPPRVALVQGLIFGVIWAPATFGLLLALDRRQRRRGAGSDATDAVDSSGVVTLPVDLASARAAASRGLQALPKAAVVNASENRLDLRVGWSWKSWGERVEVQLEPEGAATKVTVRSSPRVPTTLVDYGKGRSNVQTLLDAITAEGHRPA